MFDNPYAQFNFQLTLDSKQVAGFSEVAGLSNESDVIEYREGCDPVYVRKLPGVTKYGNITLKHGYTSNMELWNWRKSTLDGKTERKEGAVILLNEEGKEALRWEFFGAWINKYEGPALNATANEVAIESVELVVEYWRLVKP
ncbi:MAG TPA: phage tail protein [Arachnia sp.]|nr:phage tail protein [Arachnia sp.]HMT85311.1 phage tail protein [Arachnia sp.]